MAEKSLAITNKNEGQSVAIRDAFALDDNSNARVIQRITWTNLHFPSPIGTPTRHITAADSYDLDTCPAELVNNAIVMGDKTRIALWAELSLQGYIYVYPLLFDILNNPIGILEHTQLEGDYTNGTYRTTGNTERMSGVEIWGNELAGAAKVGLYIPTYTSSAYAKVWGFAF